MRSVVFPTDLIYFMNEAAGFEYPAASSFLMRSKS